MGQKAKLVAIEVIERQKEYKSKMGLDVGVQEVLEEVIYENINVEDSGELGKADRLLEEVTKVLKGTGVM